MKKTFNLIVFLVFVTFILSSCSSGGGSALPILPSPTPTAPAAPTGVSATAGDGQTTIAWTAVSGATSYNIYWSTTTGVTPATGTKITGATSPYTQTGLTHGITYYYVVTAVNGSGESAASAQASCALSPLKVFVTSGTYDGNLGGLSGADAACQAEATSAGLTGTYKAWLSTSTVDAYCHIQGYTGTVVLNCGQSTLPVAAGPWVRTHDGFPFAGTIDKLINNHQVYAPVIYDATGTHTTALFYFTGTNIDGTYAGAGLTCTDWTSNLAPSAIGGSVNGAASGWTFMGGANCTAGAGIQLLCMQTGVGGPLPSITAPTPSNKVFVTSVTGTGDMSTWTDSGGVSGVAGGDAVCQARAAVIVPAVADPTKFKAWLSDGSTNAIDHVTATATGPWYRLDGVKVADNIAALTGALGTPLFTAIGYTEMGTYIDVNFYPVWTGTNENGNAAADHCNSWVDGTAGHDGQAGWAAQADGYWTNWAHPNCDNLYALYCFEDD